MLVTENEESRIIERGMPVTENVSFQESRILERAALKTTEQRQLNKEKEDTVQPSTLGKV